MVRDLPANMTVAMLPTTLSGERYVALLLPARLTMARLVADSVITQNHAADAVEVERMLNNLLPPRGCVAKCAENPADQRLGRDAGE
jgi:phospholipid/cholesterol/gamma-HCH transport system substrate-binding protein